MTRSGINNLTISKNNNDQYHVSGLVWPQIDKYNKLIKVDFTDDSEDIHDLLEEFVSALNHLGYIKTK